MIIHTHYFYDFIASIPEWLWMPAAMIFVYLLLELSFILCGIRQTKRDRLIWAGIDAIKS